MTELNTIRLVHAIWRLRYKSGGTSYNVKSYGRFILIKALSLE